MVAGDGKIPFLQPMNPDYKFFTRADIDSFFFLFFDNMSSLLGILGVMATVLPNLAVPFGSTEHDAHIEAFRNMIWLRCCPGIVMALAFGNLAYAWQAAKLAGYDKRTDVTALPYGINTPAGFLMAWNVMLPIARDYLNSGGDCPGFEDLSPVEWANKVWQAACTANFVGGLFEVLGAVLAPWLRQNISRATMYGSIGAVGFVWLGLAPMMEVMKEPIIGMIPLAICFTGFFANKGLGCYKIPGMNTILIFTVGAILKWAGASKYYGNIPFLAKEVSDAYHNYAGANNMFGTGQFVVNATSGETNSYPLFPLGNWDKMDVSIAIVFPVAIQSFLETMQNVESAASTPLGGGSGDQYNLVEAMVTDGLGTMFGAFCGCPIPTTVYIGHMRHKTIGAHAGYSIANAGVYFILMMTGIFPTIYYMLDSTSIGVVLIGVGFMIGQQAFTEVHPRHYPALFVALFCLIADYCTLNANATHVGIHNLAAGAGIVASFVITQIVCDLIDQRYVRCAIVCAISVLLCLFGILHGMNLVDVYDKAPDSFPIRQCGKLTVKGQLTIATKDNLPGWPQNGAGNGGPQGWEPALCTQPPEFRVDQTRFLRTTDEFGTRNIRTVSDGMNEGWRFCVAYTMVLFYCLFQIALQKFGLLDGEPIMDNGVPLPGATDLYGTSGAPKVTKTASTVVSTSSSDVEMKVEAVSSA